MWRYSRTVLSIVTCIGLLKAETTIAFITSDAITDQRKTDRSITRIGQKRSCLFFSISDVIININNYYSVVSEVSLDNLHLHQVDPPTTLELSPSPTIVNNDDPVVELESEVLMDVGHIFGDFSIFMTQSKSILRKAQIVGRIIFLVQDYLPDKHIQTEELIIQLFMISISVAREIEDGDDDIDTSRSSNDWE